MYCTYLYNWIQRNLTMHHHASKVVISLQPWPLGCTDHLNSAGLDFDVQNHPNSAKFRWPMAGWSFICGHKLRKKCLKEIEGVRYLLGYGDTKIHKVGSNRNGFWFLLKSPGLRKGALLSSDSVTPKPKPDRTAALRQLSFHVLSLFRRHCRGLAMALFRSEIATAIGWFSVWDASANICSRYLEMLWKHLTIPR